MNSIDYLLKLSNLDKNIELIKIFFVLSCSYYIFIRITNIKKIDFIQVFIGLIIIFFLSIISNVIRYIYNNFYSVLFQISLMILLNKVIFKKDINYTVFNTIISIGVNYVLLIESIIISFIPNVIFGIKNDYINIIILMFVYIVLIYKKLK